MKKEYVPFISNKLNIQTLERIMFNKSIKYALVLAIVGVLSACGGGSGSDSNGTIPPANREISTGTITGFGSVYINGTRYDTSDALVTSDDTELSDVTELKVGMKASVTSDSSSQKASDVKYEEDVKGPADAEIADFKAAPFSVMGQLVTADETTIIDDSISMPVIAGAILEISGIRQGDDSILASYIEDKELSKVNKFKVIGNARSINTTDKKFMIGDLEVDYSSADVRDLLSGDPAEGQLLEVKDENLGYVAGSNMLMATKVEPFDTFTGNDDPTEVKKVEIETAVIEIVIPGEQFKIPNFTVNIDPQTTTFRYGTADELGVGSVVQIKALRNADGELDADRITFKRNSTRMQAAVDNGGVDVDKNQLTLLGVTVQINDNTDMEDDRDRVFPFDISNINDGDYLQIRGFTSVDNIFIANRLERDGFRDRAEIRSIATNIDADAQSLEVLGITVTAGPGTQFNDGASSAEEFFASITEGLSVVKVKWDPFTDTASAPKEMEIEDNFNN